MYMDDTAVVIKHASDYQKLQYALNKYYKGTNALFNVEKTEAILIGHSSYDAESPSAELPVKPVPIGTPVRYLGAYLGTGLEVCDLVKSSISRIS
ncbi:hypothetical protein EC988_001995, partial [Linderina pennispora]